MRTQQAQPGLTFLVTLAIASAAFAQQRPEDRYYGGNQRHPSVAPSTTS
jgi:hypothetical protein